MGPTSAGARQRPELDDPAVDPVERTAAQTAQRATLAEQLERDAHALAAVPAREWAERKADLDQRLAHAQARAAATMDIKAAATLARAADVLAAAKPPPAVPALPGEDTIRAGVEDRSADPGDVLDWVAGLPAASRRELWHRYEQASSGGRAKGSAADEFARELANYVARRRIRDDLHRLTSMSERQVRAWRAANHARRATAGPDETPATAEHGPAGPATEIGAAATGVEEAVARARLPFSGGHHEVAIARAIRGLTEAIDHAPGKLSGSDREAIGRALRIANDHAQRTGPGVGRAIHGPLLEAQAAAGRHGYAIDVATEALLPDGAASVSAGDLREITERSERQIARAIPQLRTWNLTAEADELQRMVNLVGWAAHTPQGLDDAGRKRVLLQAQTLFEAAGELDTHIQLATSAGIEPGTAEHRAFAKVLSAYAHAMARSGIDADPLAEARLEKQRLPLNLARASSAAGRAGLDTLSALDPRQAKHAERAYDGLDKRIHELDGRMHEGAAVDAADVAEVAVRARELSFKNRVLTMEAQLEALATAATKADEGWVAFFANAYAIDFKALPGKLREQRGFMAGFRAGLDRNVRDALARIDDPDPKRRALREVEARRAALDFVEKHLADYLKTERLQQMLEGAIHAINDAGTRAIVTELIAQAALMLAMSAGAGLVAAQVGKVAAAGTTLAAESVVSAASAARLASVAGFVTTVAADAALNTAGQKLLLNDQASWKTLFTTNAAVSLALAPLGGLFARWGSSVSEAEVRTAKLWQARGVRIVATTAQITFEMVAAAAVDYAVRRAEHEKTQSLDEMTATQWLLQGATMALGRAIGSRMHGLHERFGAWAERTAFTPEQLARVQALALAAETHGRTADAQEAAIEYARLVEAEHEALQAMARDGDGDPAKLRTLLAGNDAARAELGTAAFAELPLRLAGLEPENAAGLIWRGSPDEIQAAIKAVQAGGHPIEVVAQGSASTPWRLRLGGRDLEIVETPPKAARARARTKRTEEHATNPDNDSITPGTTTSAAAETKDPSSPQISSKSTGTGTGDSAPHGVQVHGESRSAPASNDYIDSPTSAPAPPGLAPAPLLGEAASGQRPTHDSPPHETETLAPDRYRPINDENIGGSVSKTRLIDTASGTVFLFKPASPDAPIPLRAQERGLSAESIPQRAAAASVLAKKLGIPSPETRIVKYNGVVGSLQEWHQDQNSFTLHDLEDSRPDLYQKVLHSPEYLRFRSNLDAFDYLIDNLDRNPGNLLVAIGAGDVVTRVTAIDHDLTFTRSATRFVDELGIWSRDLPGRYTRAFVARLRALRSSPEAFREAMAPFLGESEIGAALARADIILADIDAKLSTKGPEGTFLPSPATTAPSLAPDPEAKPRGTATPVPLAGTDQADNIAALTAENASASVLAVHGYDVEQNPRPPTGSLKNPDYLVEGEYFDNYAPTNSKPRNIWSVVEQKVSSQQASRIVLNLDGTAVSEQALAKQFREWPIAGLEELLVVRGGSVTRLVP